MATPKPNAGTCAICGGTWMLVKRGHDAGRLVNHGYQRPWEGHQTSGCYGEKALPYERSTDVLTRYIPYLETLIETEQNLVTRYETDPPTEVLDDLAICKRREMPPKIGPDHHHYKAVITGRLSKSKRLLDALTRERKRAQRLLDEWPGEKPLLYKPPAPKQRLVDLIEIGKSYRFRDNVGVVRAKGLARGHGVRPTYDGVQIELTDGRVLTVRARQLQPLETS